MSRTCGLGHGHAALEPPSYVIIVEDFALLKLKPNRKSRAIILPMWNRNNLDPHVALRLSHSLKGR